MSPSWWVTYAIIAMYGVNSIWLATYGKWWASAYWVLAAGLTVCAMRGMMR